MEEVLDVLNQAADERAPVVALDERPVQLWDSLRPGTPMAPAKVARRDYQYARCGTANIFCIVAPKGGRHHTHATPNRTAPRFAAALERIAKSYPAAETIHLVMDNLNTHCEKSLADHFGTERGRQLWAHFTVHYTPTAVGSIRPNSRRACGRASAWATTASPALPSCGGGLASGTPAPMAAGAVSTGLSPAPMPAACSVTNKVLRMGRSTNASQSFGFSDVVVSFKRQLPLPFGFDLSATAGIGFSSGSSKAAATIPTFSFPGRTKS